MTLKEIKEHFEITKLSDCYALYDNQKSIYTDYRGNTMFPFVGCIKRNGSKFIFVYEGLKLEEKQFKNIDDLKELVADYVSKCTAYGVTTDCCNPMYNTAFQCEIATLQFVRNNTELEFINNVIKVGSSYIRIEIKEFQFRINIEYKKDVFMKHTFDNPFETLSYIKALFRILLMVDIISPIKNIREMSATEVNERYDLFEDVLYKADLPTFSVQQIGTLREQLISELEDVLQQLKQ